MATITTLASFDGEDGLQPLGNLVADAAGDLFGVTSVGGAHGEGEVFEIAKTPAGYADTPTILGSFDSLDDGVPTGALIMDGSGDLFGETEADNYGTVFEIAKTATGYASTPTILASFDMYGEDDSTGGPTGNLVADANGDLFGSTLGGSVFEIAKTSGGFASAPTIVASFAPGQIANSVDSLVIDSAGDLFGSLSSGAGILGGSVIEIAKTSTGYAAPVTLAYLTAGSGVGSSSTGLTLDAAGDLFGTLIGPSNPFGAVFELPKSASGYASAPTLLANLDGPYGETPSGSLLLNGSDDVFGTTEAGGDGMVYEIAKTSTGYAATPVVLASFDGPDGQDPAGGLTADGTGDLFGVTSIGGLNDDGTVFELSGAPFPGIAITSAGGVTTNATQTIAGTIDLADAGQTVSIYDGATLLGTATPDANGDWSANVDLPIFGPQSITAQATDTAGQLLTSAPVVYTLYQIVAVTPGPGATVDSGNGYVKLFDLSGDDTLRGGSGHEYLRVFSGDNLLDAGSGPNTLVGGSGDDTLIGGAGSKLIGGSGDESLVGPFLLGGGMGETLVGGSGHDTLSVYNGSNRLVAGSGFSTLWGGSGDDTLVGGSGMSVAMHAGSGVQRLLGGTVAGSADTMFGGSGPDYMQSNAGDDRMIAGSGDDTMVGGSGNDRMWSSFNASSRDVIYGGSGDDKIFLRPGSTSAVFAGSGHDTILAGLQGDDTITGGSGTATVYTSETQSQVSGESNNSAGYLEITFTNAQVLTVKGVTVYFHGGGGVST